MVPTSHVLKEEGSMVPSLMLRMKGCLVAPVYSRTCFFIHPSIIPLLISTSSFVFPSIFCSPLFLLLLLNTQRVEYFYLFVCFGKKLLYQGFTSTDPRVSTHIPPTAPHLRLGCFSQRLIIYIFFWVNKLNGHAL